MRPLIRRPVTRRVLRFVQLGLGVWVASALVRGLIATPAYADHCAAFTDCFGVANSAVEAAFGLSLLAALSLVLDFVPVVGTAKGLIEGVIGRDLLTGQELAPWERALGVLPLIGGLTALKYADDLVGVGRRADLPPPGRGAGEDFGGLGRRGDDTVVPTPTPRNWPPGTGRPVDPDARPLVDRYVNGNTATRRAVAEQLGERGGLQYLSDATGRPVGVLRPTTDADVAPLLDLVDQGRAWSHAVAYGGSRATNLVYFDGQKLIIIEAKGGGSGYGERWSNLYDGMRMSQTHPEYPRDVAVDMSNSGLRDGRNDIGDLIEDFYDGSRVEYVGVRTGGYGDLVAGNPLVRLEHVFRAPAVP